jgi:hypothetical protein
MGFLDDAFGEDTEAFEAELRERARRLARDPEFRLMLRKKHERRLDDEYAKPLASYRAEELEWMRVNFFGPDPANHEARRRFVFKGVPPPQGGRAPIEAAVESRVTRRMGPFGPPRPKLKVGNVLHRLSSLKRDPWQGFFKIRQRLPQFHHITRR